MKNEGVAKLSELFKGIELSNLRVIQKNLVYVIGLSPELAHEKVILSSFDKTNFI